MFSLQSLVTPSTGSCLIPNALDLGPSCWTYVAACEFQAAAAAGGIFLGSEGFPGIVNHWMFRSNLYNYFKLLRVKLLSPFNLTLLLSFIAEVSTGLPQLAAFSVLCLASS